MFSPDSELLHIFAHTSYRFHATIGLDPFGNFQEIDGLEYSVPSFEYKELGRNHAPWKLPFEGPASPGELTLKWGMIVRSKLYDWIHDVKLGKDFQKDVWIFQLSQKAIPLRIYHLSGCWPVKWESGAFSASGPAEMATETVTLAYDNMDMANLSLLAMAGDLVDEPIAALVNELRPKSYAAIARNSQHQLLGQGGRRYRYESYLPTTYESDFADAVVDAAWEAEAAGDAGALDLVEASKPQDDDPLEHFTWDPIEQKKLKERKPGKPPKALERFGWAAAERSYAAQARATNDRKPLARAYKALGGSFFRDPLQDDYVAMGGVSALSLDDLAAAGGGKEGGDEVATGEGQAVEKKKGS